MDVLRHNGIRQIVVLLDVLDLNNLGLEEEVTSYTITPVETKERGRKSHIPSVTTVPREDSPISGDRQARRRPIAVRDEKKKTIDPLPAVTDEKTTEAESGQIHDTPNTVEGAHSDDRSSSAATQGSEADPRLGVGTGNEAPDKVESQSSTHDVTAPSVVLVTAAKTVSNKTTRAEAEEKKTLDKTKSQVTATITYKNFTPQTPVDCHRCKKRRLPDVEQYTRHNPRFCPRKY